MNDDAQITRLRELVDQIEAAGGRLVWTHGQPRIRGEVPPDLLAIARSQRDAVIAEFERRTQERRDRWGRVPLAEETAGLRAELSRVSKHVAGELLGLVMRQGERASMWVALRANAYFTQYCGEQTRWTPLDCEVAAALDLIEWQNPGRPWAEVLATAAAAAEVSAASDEAPAAPVGGA